MPNLYSDLPKDAKMTINDMISKESKDTGKIKGNSLNRIFKMT